ncbi:hypothetical protein M8J76_005215 [Diaphorina citri]|jgi:CS domain.|nr:hypothetical protein M8J75_014433 [Diaphorina citri]KAI5744796.1 hypothetical protein M8J76_005215 [Diaphorina citri]KAI5752943.1 hypothetical protein M8J77_022128 [Diaphorina citri]
MTQIPPVIWAQRKDKILITFCVENCNNPKIDIEPDEIKFDAVSADKKHYKLDIKLFKSINAEKSIKTNKDRHIELVLKKLEEDVVFWPHLTKEKQKYHWLKVDFDKWVDEDEEEEEEMGGAFNEDMMSGLNLGGMGGLGGMDGFNYGDEDDDDGPLSDSDDEDQSQPKTDEPSENITPGPESKSE